MEMENNYPENNRLRINEVLEQDIDCAKDLELTSVGVSDNSSSGSGGSSSGSSSSGSDGSKKYEITEQHTIIVGTGGDADAAKAKDIAKVNVGVPGVFLHYVGIFSIMRID